MVHSSRRAKLGFWPEKRAKVRAWSGLERLGTRAANAEFALPRVRLGMPWDTTRIARMQFGHVPRESGYVPRNRRVDCHRPQVGRTAKKADCAITGCSSSPVENAWRAGVRRLPGCCSGCSAFGKTTPDLPCPGQHNLAVEPGLVGLKRTEVDPAGHAPFTTRIRNTPSPWTGEGKGEGDWSSGHAGARPG
jgi:hypothetical protein